MQCSACSHQNNDGARFCAKCGAPMPQTAPVDPLLGQKVDDYTFEAVIGEGGMGRVYVAKQPMGNKTRKVAIKTLLAQYAADPQIKGRFLREAGNVIDLHHPNTIKYYKAGEIPGTGQLYIAMEFLEGESLDEVLSRGQPLPPERVERIIGQVCGSLQEAHEVGLVHRDLKPANIFLTKRQIDGENVVKVLDFGIAKESGAHDKAEQKLTQQGTILGTPPYMSPEQFTGKALDARSDIYSLGVVTYEMLTGRLPYDADSPWQWMTAHMSAHPFPFETTPMGAHVPPKMRAAVMRALEKDPARRPQSAREFFEDLSTGGARMSVLGLAPGGVGAIPTHHGAGTAVLSGGPTTGPGMIPASGGARSGATQIGEPIFPGGGAHAPAKTMTGEAAPYGGGGSPAVPTGGGQVYPAPPPAARKSGGGPGLAVIGIVAFVLIAGGAGAFFYMKGRPSDGDETVAVDVPTGKKPATSPDDDDDDGDDDGPGKTSAASGAGSDPTGASSSSGAPTADVSAKPTSAPTTQPTTQPTASTKPPTNPTTQPTGPKPQAGIDGCCASLFDRTKRKLCNGINEGIKSGRINRNAGLATLRSQGVNCN